MTGIGIKFSLFVFRRQGLMFLSKQSQQNQPILTFDTAAKTKA
jgi:hypothetical protein